MGGIVVDFWKNESEIFFAMGLDMGDQLGKLRKIEFCAQLIFRIERPANDASHASHALVGQISCADCNAIIDPPHRMAAHPKGRS
jgi:hypothetical protein